MHSTTDLLIYDEITYTTTSDVVSADSASVGDSAGCIHTSSLWYVNHNIVICTWDSSQLKL